MNDEDLVSTNACEAALPSDGPSIAQTAEGGAAAEEGTEAGTDLCQPIAESGESELTEEIGSASDSVSASQISDDPVSDPDPLLPEDPESDQTESVEHLRNELNRLREEIHAREDFYSRIGRDYEEFRTLYPNVSVSDLPDSVWHDVRCGIPIAAAYALAEQRGRRLAEQAAAVNLENSARSSGALQATEPEFFSPAEVRAMSRDEVRHNYQKILRSMKTWN